MADQLDYLDRERFSPLGETPMLVLDAREDASRYRDGNSVLVGVDREGALPAVDAAAFDVLLSAAPAAPRPWLCVPLHALDAKIEALEASVRGAPHAAGVLRQVLRLTEALPLNDALLVESLAYSTLLGGDDFRRWRMTNPASAVNNVGAVRYTRDGDHVTLTLAQPDTRNAMNAAMRDALFEALASVLDDPSAPLVTLKADGACFSVGGDLNEFGANADLAAAHTIRTARSIARLIADLGDRIDVEFHGACIGSGLEAPAAAARRAARDGAFFQLPELKMGLIPGAGGTASVTRAIGRHRACAMMLSGARVSTATALDWGLVQTILPGA